MGWGGAEVVGSTGHVLFRTIKKWPSKSGFATVVQNFFEKGHKTGKKFVPGKRTYIYLKKYVVWVGLAPVTQCKRSGLVPGWSNMMAAYVMFALVGGTTA